jgi:hypothetical protein
MRIFSFKINDGELMVWRDEEIVDLHVCIRTCSPGLVALDKLRTIEKKMVGNHRPPGERTENKNCMERERGSWIR